MNARYIAAPTTKPLAVRGLGPWPDVSKRCRCQHRTNQHRGSHGRAGQPGYVATGHCLVCDCQKYQRAEVAG